MKNAQEWLNEKHPLNQRRAITEINNSYGEELTGELVIENFPNLQGINLASNKNITKLTIHACPLIEKIEVFNNQITELIINELTNLKYLNCANNQLTKLDLNQNTKIRELLSFGNPRLRKENFKGVEKLTQLISFKGDKNLQPMQILQDQLRQTQQQLDLIKQDLEIKTQQVVSNNNLIVSVQNELGVANLNNLPLIPQGETLHTLLQRPKQEALEIIQNELNIERDHAQDMDNWYRRLINEELGNELLQIQYESRLKSNSIVKLESENEIIKQLAAMEIKDNLNLFSQIQAKKKELKQLKISIRSKLNEIQKIFLKNLLTAQEQLIYLKNATQQMRWPSERLLQIAKQNLSNELSREEINLLCQLQVETTDLEIQLGQIKKDKLEARIEINQFPRFEG